MLAILFIWIISMSFTVPILLMSKYDENDRQCILIIQQCGLICFIYIVIYTSVIIFIPTISLSILYIMIIYKLKVHYKTKLNENIYLGKDKFLCAPSTVTLTSQQPQVTQLTEFTDLNYNNKPSNLAKKTFQLESPNHKKFAKIKLFKSKTNVKKSKYHINFNDRSCVMSNNDEKVAFNSEFGVKINKTNHNNNNTNNVIHKNDSENSLKRKNSLERRHSSLVSLTNSIPNTKNNKVTRSTATSGKGFNNINAQSSRNDRKHFTMAILTVTIAFFCCQLPLRIFILWSSNFHLHHDNIDSPLPSFNNETRGCIQHSNTSSSIASSSNASIDYELVNSISFIARLIYFLHGISNPIIYNISSSKFRRAFFSLLCMSKCNNC